MTLLKRSWRLLVQNFWWRVLALVLAVAIWALVASEPELSMFATVPLQYRNLPDELEMSSPPAETVTLELRGPAGELRGFGDNRPASVVLEMSDMTPGVHTFSIGSGNVRLARGVRMIRAIPSEVRFDFDTRLVRMIPVQVRFKGENDYKVARYTAVPDQVAIVGPSRHVQRVILAFTDPVDVSSTVSTAGFRVNAFVDDSYVRFQSSPEVAVTVTMKKK